MRRPVPHMLDACDDSSILIDGTKAGEASKAISSYFSDGSDYDGVVLLVFLVFARQLPG